MSVSGSGNNDLLANPGLASQQWVRTLASIYRRQRVSDPAKAPRDDNAWWRKALRDPCIRKAVAKRTHSVAGREWRVLAATETRAEDKCAASIVEEALDNVSFFDRSRALLATAIFRGSSYARIYGERRFCQLGFSGNAPLPPRWWWIPTHLEDVDPLRFEKRRDPKDEKLKWFFGSVSEVAETPWTYDEWEPLKHPHHFVRHVHEPTEASLGYGQGLQDALEFPLWAKQELWRDYLSGARKAARGFFDVKTDTLRNGMTDAQAAQEVSDWQTCLDVAHEDGDVIHGSESTVTLLPMPENGLTLVMHGIERLDSDMTSLILFGTLPTGSGGDGVGSFARAKEEGDQGREAFHFDQSALSESITKSLIQLFWDLNKENLASVGCGGARRPSFEIGNEQRPDPKAASEVVKDLTAAGLGKHLRVDEVLARCGGWTPAKPGEDTLGSPSSPPGAPAAPAHAPPAPAPSVVTGGPYPPATS